MPDASSAFLCADVGRCTVSRGVSRAAVLITGGPGSRLRPLTNSLPKRCLPVGNVPMQEHMLRWLAEQGAREAVMGTSSQEAPGGVPEASDVGLQLLRVCHEDSPLGTAGFLRLAATGVSERFIAANGDILTDLRLAPLCALAEASDADLAIAATQVADPERYGVIETDGPRVVRFVEKPSPRQARSNLVSMGVYVIHPRALDRVPNGCPYSLEHQLIGNLLDSDASVIAYEAPGGYWLDVGTREAYLQANRDVALRRSPYRGRGQYGDHCLVADTASVDPQAVVIAGTCVGPGCRVEPNAYVAGSVLVSANIVAEGASVVDSVLGPGVSVGPGASVRSAVVGLTSCDVDACH